MVICLVVRAVRASPELATWCPSQPASRRAPLSLRLLSAVSTSSSRMEVPCATRSLSGVQPNSGWARWLSRANTCAQRGRLPKRCGAPNNPMGVAALTLSGGEYAIHGTNRPESIGKFASYGCIRMYNEDIAHLFQWVDVGTPVVVTR